jgi:hypothetical protein
MTAEVAILNKTAVALAADSAITLGSQKIYNSGNKLFSLSKYQPVGIMVFGNAEFMGIPWETIIKYYRSQLKNRKFNELIDYAKDFISFIENENAVFWPQDIQAKYFRETVKSYFQIIVIEINERVKNEFAKGNVTIDMVTKIVSDIIETHHKDWRNAPDLFPECEKFIHQIVENQSELIEQLKKDIFQQLPVSSASYLLLTEICALIFCKLRFSDSSTGVVIAGFGEKEIFPAAIEYRLEAVMLGKLKYTQGQYVRASREQNAVIMPFAQQEMVKTFMEGIDPSYNEVLHSYFNELLIKYPENILAIIPELSEQRKQELLGKLSLVANEAIKDFGEKTNNYTTQNHVAPVLQAVYALPKDELASMAESLVNLTSFKRKISLQAETVGGPIDVAVISKGDGFIWIKRKHYFKSELNQVFFSNYYRDESTIQENE